MQTYRAFFQIPHLPLQFLLKKMSGAILHATILLNLLALVQCQMTEIFYAYKKKILTARNNRVGTDLCSRTEDKLYGVKPKKITKFKYLGMLCYVGIIIKRLPCFSGSRCCLEQLVEVNPAV